MAFGAEDDRDYDVVRPVGTFRFLTKLDTLREGDLYRAIVDHSGNISIPLSNFVRNWTLVGDEYWGSSLVDLDPENMCEVIRPVDGTSVPQFTKEN